MSPISLTPLASLRLTKHLIPPHPPFPNSRPTGRPLLIYHSAFPPSSSLTPASISTHLRSIGIVEPAWTYPMYTEHHYHSTTHEVLVVHSGSAKLCFGGKENPERVEVQVGEGDVMVVPAGYAHAMLRDTSHDEKAEGRVEDRGKRFSMVGSYPAGASQWDHQTGEVGEEGERRMRALGWFEGDPIYGDQGPVLDV